MSNPLPPYSTFRTDNKVRLVGEHVLRGSGIMELCCPYVEGYEFLLLGVSRAFSAR